MRVSTKLSASFGRVRTILFNKARDASTYSRTKVSSSHVFPIIDRMCSRSLTEYRQPFVEYLFVKPAWFKRFSFSISGNPYGHSVIRYSLENGKSVIVNISSTGSKLIYFFDPDEYMFTRTICDGNQQGGICNRSFISVRMNNVDQKIINEMHNHYLEIEQKRKDGEVGYGLILYPITNLFRPLFHTELLGNCASWISHGMAKVGLLNDTSSWPLLIWFRLLIQNYRKNKSNLNVIAYRSVHNKDDPKGSLIYPFYWLKNKYHHIWNLDNFADIIVEYNNNKFDIRTNKNAMSKWRELYRKFRRKIVL